MKKPKTVYWCKHLENNDTVATFTEPPEEWCLKYGDKKCPHTNRECTAVKGTIIWQEKK